MTKRDEIEWKIAEGVAMTADEYEAAIVHLLAMIDELEAASGRGNMITREETTMKTVKHFEHPFSGVSNETVAVFTDGTSANVCVQYNSVQPRGDHADDCSQITKMGGRCSCGLLDDIDVPALMEAAKKSGKFGRAPVERILEPALSTAQRGDGWCDKCQSYCYGDCELID